jgi:oxamate amidohydrolase
MHNPNAPATGRPPTFAPLGMVATSHYLATGTGLNILRRGGSAVDAAIAANAVLCVAYPHMAGIGGDAFFLIHEPGEGGVRAINASGPAARLANPEFYKGRGHNESIPQRGPLSALTVPGCVDGWRVAHERYGRLEWSSLFDDAVRYARTGVPVGMSLASWLVSDEGLLKKRDETKAVFLPGGRVPRRGERIVNTGLADSFERIARDGARSFYEGRIAQIVCDALKLEGSPLRQEDFAEFHAEWVEPISTEYRGRRVYEFPPNTQGFAALAILNLIEEYDLKAWGDGSAEYYHHMAEAVKVAFADRDAWLTDPKFLDIPIERLLDKGYARERRGLIEPDRSLPMGAVVPGIAYDRERRVQAVESAGGDTCSFCAVDSDGLAVSAIESIYHDFGSGVIAGESGIILQNRGAFFSLDEDHPNALQPGKRSFHTLTPAMLFDGDDLELVYGTMGGEGQPQTHTAIVTRIVDFGYDVQSAIEAPRWLMGRTWGTQSKELWLENRVADPVVRDLERRGQPVSMGKAFDDKMGHAQAIRIDHERGFLEGGADPRGDGAAMGY